eukprot:9500000-Pyramimonas_sp.AAC.1
MHTLNCVSLCARLAPSTHSSAHWLTPPLRAKPWNNSLGAKLHLLLASEKGGPDGPDGVAVDTPPAYAGHVLVAFNNASAVDT